MDIVRAKKRFGQNFLHDERILEKISSVINLENKNVIEIGPGQGALTKHILNRAKGLVVFEIDRDLINLLSDKFKDEKRLKIISGDFLKQDLREYRDYVIVSNIPYNISTDIVFTIFEHHELFSDVVLLVQKEFAQRLCAKLGSKDYSKLTLSTQLFYEANYCFEVSPNCFNPKPKVTSAVVYLKRRDNLDNSANYKKMLNLIKKCFSMRRKTLWNNIKDLINQELFKQFCLDNNLDINARPENLTLDNYFSLYEFVKDNL